MSKATRLHVVLGIAALTGAMVLAAAAPATATTRPRPHVTVTAQPAKLWADGIAKSRLTIKAQFFGRIPDRNAVVTLTAQDNPTGACGALRATTGRTNRDGIFQTSYRTSLVSGFCVVTANVGKGKGSVTIDQRSPLAKVPYVVKLATQSSKVTANGTATTSLTVTVTNGSAGVSGDPVLVTGISGRPGSCGVVALGSTSTSSSGGVTAVYTASNVRGSCQLKATEALSGASSNAVTIQQT
jgi:hypothetical protein